MAIVVGSRKCAEGGLSFQLDIRLTAITAGPAGMLAIPDEQLAHVHFDG